MNLILSIKSKLILYLFSSSSRAHHTRLTTTTLHNDDDSAHTISHLISFTEHVPCGLALSIFFLIYYFATLFRHVTHVVWHLLEFQTEIFIIFFRGVFPFVYICMLGPPHHPGSTVERVRKLFNIPCNMERTFSTMGPLYAHNGVNNEEGRGGKKVNNKFLRWIMMNTV